MRQIINNRYLEVFKFSLKAEAETFFNNQSIGHVLKIDDFLGDYYYCYVVRNSLTGKGDYLLFFSSDKQEENLNFLFWNTNLFVLDVGQNIYFLDKELNIKSSFEIITPLIGLFLTKGNNLVVLEETWYRLINDDGQVLSNESFDLIENFSLSDDKLFIQTAEENKHIDLI